MLKSIVTFALQPEIPDLQLTLLFLGHIIKLPTLRGIKTMPENYITLSLETHLFFARIIKEHALFLAAGFPCKNKD